MRDEDEKCKGCGKVAITLCRTDTLKSTTIMMKTNKFQLIIIMCFACGIVAAQCPVHDTDDMIILKSQEQVDSLLIDFPNCTVLKNLEISLNRSDVGTPINNLEPLTQLTQIETELSIRRNIASNSLPDLENLNGLDNLKELGILTIIRTNKLKSLKELNQLAKLSELNVSEAPLLAEIGMNNIEVSHTLSLFKAPELTTIEGVTITDEMETLVILDVPKLELQNQLRNLTLVHDKLHLDHHDISFVSNLKEVGTLILWGNGPTQDLKDFVSLMKINDNLTLHSLQELVDFGSLENIEIPIGFGEFHLYNNENLAKISEITEFENLTSLHIMNSPLLTDVSSFQQLKTVVIMIISNTGLQDMSDFISLKNVLAYIGISKNKNLSSLAGLGSLTNIDRQLVITENEKLRDIDGLSNLVLIGDSSDGNFITISNNNILSSIHSLANTFANLRTIRIESNPQLSICHLQLVCQHILDGKETIIENNAPGCSSVKETEDQCNFPIFQKIFFDQNENGEIENEPALTIGHTVYNDTYKLYPNNSGIINLSPFDGEINLEYIPKEKWKTTTEDSFTFPDSENVDAMFIGVSPTELIDEVRVHLSFSQIICSQIYSMKITVHNSGTTIVNTEVTLDGIGEYVSASIDPILSNNTQATFEFLNFLPGQTKEIGLLFLAPDIIDVPLGTILRHALSYKVFSEANDIIYEDESYYEQELLCAYDPNDKQVFPAGVGEDNKTLKTDELQYLIRFQNTGNYYAEDITIRDTLDENLDLSTFKFVSASHQISEIKMERNALAFVFENIFLPDSIRDEPGSHGFVSYSIQAIEEIEEKAVIENTAHIYFDSNPPIVTNTVDNMMVTSLEDEVTTNDIKENSEFSIFPNPASDNISIKSDEQIGQWMLLDSRSSMIKQGNEKTSLLNIDLEKISDGIYFFKTQNQVEKIVVLK